MTLFLTAPWDDNAHPSMIELEQIRTSDERAHAKERETETERQISEPGRQSKNVLGFFFFLYFLFPTLPYILRMLFEHMCGSSHTRYGDVTEGFGYGYAINSFEFLASPSFSNHFPAVGGIKFHSQYIAP